MQIPFPYSEQNDLYHYLFMRHFELYSVHGSFMPNSEGQNYAISLLEELYNLKQTPSLNILDLCGQSQLHLTLKNSANLLENNKAQQAQKIIFAQSIIKNYPNLFLQPQTISLTIENTLFKTISDQTLILIKDHLQYQNIFQEIGLEINFFILSIVVHTKLQINTLEIHEVIRNIQAHLYQLILQINFFNNQEKQQIYAIFTQYLASTLDQRNLTQPQKTALNFILQYQEFKTKYQTNQPPSNQTQKILKLHYLHQILQNPTNYGLNQFSSHQNFKTNSAINFFNHFRTQNGQSSTKINYELLKSFIREPYQTSLFVLFNLLSECQLESIDKIFTKHPADFRAYVLVNPLSFLFFDQKAITQENAQSLSLSLWIIVSLWIKNAEENPEAHKKQHNLSIQNPEKGQYTSFVSNQGDVRQIFRIKKDSQQKSDNKNTEIPTNQSNQTVQFNNIKNYIIEMKRTIVIFLLSLKVETTMLKYYPIENQIFLSLINIDILPQLLIQSPFALKTVSSVEIRSSTNQMSEIDGLSQKQILQRIEKAENLDQIEELEKELAFIRKKSQKNQKTLSKNTLEAEIFYSEYNQWRVPWISLFEDKEIFSALKPNIYTLQLAFKLAQRRPHTTIKIYAFSLLGKSLEFLQFMLSENDTKRSGKDTYKFKGNRNVVMKKSIDPFPKAEQVPRKRNEFELKNKLTNEEKKKYLNMSKRIIEIYKRLGVDQKAINAEQAKIKLIQKQNGL